MTHNQERAIKKFPHLAKSISGEMPFPKGKPSLAKTMPVCIHRGERLTMEEGKQHHQTLLQLGVKCSSCSGKRHEFHCSKHQFTNAGKCRSCHDFTPNT